MQAHLDISDDGTVTLSLEAVNRTEKAAMAAYYERLGFERTLVDNPVLHVYVLREHKH